MSVREFVGARYVPIVVGEWDKTRTYEPLMVVINQGNSYTSRQYVPADIEITDEKFWVLTGNYNAQVEAYRKEVQTFINKCEHLNENVLEYENFESAVNDELIEADTYIKTAGFYTPGDGGESYYHVSKNFNIINTIAKTNNNNYLNIVVSDEISPKMVGAYGNGTNDDTSSIEKIATIYNNNENIKVINFNGYFAINNNITFTHSIGQTYIKGNDNNSNGIVCKSANSGITFNGNPTFYELHIGKVIFNGNNISTPFTANHISNFYANGTHFISGNTNQYGAQFNSLVIANFNQCTIEGGSDISNDTHNNGLYFNNADSILNVSNCNIWNLKTGLEIGTPALNVNINNNWFECVDNPIKYVVNDNNRYSNYKIIGNTFDYHPENGIKAQTFELISFDNSNYNASNSYSNFFSIENNNIYIANNAATKNGALIYNSTISQYTYFFTFNSNTLSGQHLSDKLYVWKTDSSTASYLIMTFGYMFESTAYKYISNNNITILNNASYNTEYFNNGISIGNPNDDAGAGKIQFINGEFFTNISGTQKLMPKRIDDVVEAYSSNYFTDHPERIASAFNTLFQLLSRCYLFNYSS